MGITQRGTKEASDEREQVMWDNYLTQIKDAPGSKPSAYKACIKAKYSKDHCRNITMQKWFKTRLKNLAKGKRLSRAEKNLEEIQLLDLIRDVVVGRGDNKEVVEMIDPNVLRVRTDVDKFIAKTHDKETYTERSEITGKDGKDLVPTKEEKEAITAKIREIL